MTQGAGWKEFTVGGPNGLGRRRKVRVPHVEVGVDCAQGRHRSTMVALRLKKYLEHHGCTVRIIHDTLWRGATNRVGKVDTRGPCGCHLNPRLCQYAPQHNPRAMKEWCDAMKDAKKEAEEKYQELEAVVYEQLGNWSG